MKKLLLYFHTVRHLKFKQIYYRIYYVLRGQYRQLIGYQYPQKVINNNYSKLKLSESLTTTDGVFTDGKTFRFLNLEYTFDNKINWNFSGHKKLWTYNLNYFEYLHQKNFSKELGLKLIHDFIQNFTQSKDGLEPYPISLRVIHWVKFLTYHDIKDEKIDTSLYNQLWELVDKREYHILGNHLLENGFGVLFGAYYFNDQTLYKYAKEILIKELKEQILADGSHFELSPMYHQLMLYRVLDCFNLVKNNAHFDQELFSLFEDKAEIMLGWLNQITFKNGNIPLLNDSAFNINPTTKQLLDYANVLGINSKEKKLKESGYRKVIKDKYELVLDIGHIGPNYIPGHAHSDTFNFVLYVKDRPFIVDTGLSTYNPVKRRQLERSTSAHNIVQIGSFEQSEVWSSFRVARRTTPSILIDNEEEVRASLKYATTKASHTRSFKFDNKTIHITDSIVTNECSKVFLHFHPDINVKLSEEGIETTLGIVKVNNAERIELQEYYYAPQFNLLEKATKAIITFSKQIETIITIL